MRLIAELQIEKATLIDLDWALANMDGKLKKPTKDVSPEWIKEAEVKGSNDMVDVMLYKYD